MLSRLRGKALRLFTRARGRGGLDFGERVVERALELLRLGLEGGLEFLDSEVAVLELLPQSLHLLAH